MTETMTLPFARGSATSEAAAKRMAAKPLRVNGDRERILLALQSKAMTDKELQALLGMAGDTERPRRGELVAMGRVVDTGERRDRSVVWSLA